ncbi:DNA methyltransferase [uncultured Desulfosarcina sp.]|uniref:DNA methyltransferase n=1 Tax=uncultured Desulfosarcina sp. TaxID=218289 RepID=UPI0029C667F1|nr:DNA methyltransferase [uncultured Desulfosarcina sp.]
MHKYHSSRIQKLLEELDWDCSDQIHHYNSLNILHWYPASFITAIPSNIIEIFSEEKDTIWDPFVGSGITAVESFRMNRKFYGNDLNHIAAKITLAKLNLLQYYDEIVAHFYKFKDFVEVQYLENKFKHFDSSTTHFDNISFEEIGFWYSTETLKEILLLHSIIQKYSMPDYIKIIYDVVFLNIAKIACAQQKTWGHIADNVKPNKQQIADRKYEVIKNFLVRIKQILSKTKRLIIFPKTQSYDIKIADSIDYIPPEPIKLIVTSPPYPLMIDYITSQRISYYWLNYSKNDIDSFKKNEIGARYRRHRKFKYNEYLNDLNLSFNNIIKSLANNGILAVLLPDYKDSDDRKVIIEKFYNNLSIKLERLYTVNRKIDLKNRWAPFRQLKDETLTIWCNNGKN